MKILINYIAWILAFFVQGAYLSAQPIRTVTYETKLEVADEAALNADPYGAIEWYTKAYEESKDINLQVAIADLYMVAREYNKAEKIYERILKRDKKKEYEDLRVDYAKAMKSQGKYKEAYAEFNNVIVSADMSDSIKAVANFEVEGIKLLENLAPNLEAVVNYLPGKVNTASGESSPIQGPDGSLYFASFSRKKEIVLDGKESDYHAKIYSADKNTKGEYDKVTVLPEMINRPDFNSAGVAFSRDGRSMYFTRILLNNNAIDKSVLYVSNKVGDEWGAPREIEELKGDFVIKHPIVGELFGNEVLFFSSNMAGGVGGYDIYYSTISANKFGLPTNLGTVINTSGDEVTPYYNNGTLYFSTNGRPTIGGFDIYYANWNGSNWEKLANIGFNYNSAYDDLFLRFNESGTNGFLVSNRPDKAKSKIKGSETCCDDIYSVYIRDLIIDLMLTVEDEKGPLNASDNELYDLTLGGYPDTKSNLNSNTINFPLQADREYKTIIKKEGYLPDSIKFNTNGIIDDYTVRKTIKLKKDPNYNPNKNNGEDKGETVTVTINEPIRLNNIYYDLAKHNIKPEAEKDLMVLSDLMNEYPDMVIELSSHTDSRSDDNYNQKLSQRRAESAKNWLVERGIDPNRIKPVGYGEKKLLNGCTDNKKCTEAEHQINRRTEFKIIKGPQTIEIKKEIFDKQGGQGDASPSPRSGKQSIEQEVPVITFDKEEINLGKIKKGEHRSIVFEFTNTGKADLLIEIATTCKCTDIEWPKESIRPGQRGIVKGIYHTENEKLGAISKTIDIYSNTEPIVVEAKFTAEIVE